MMGIEPPTETKKPEAQPKSDSGENGEGEEGIENAEGIFFLNLLVFFYSLNLMAF